MCSWPLPAGATVGLALCMTPSIRAIVYRLFCFCWILVCSRGHSITTASNNKIWRGALEPLFE
ncbi:unnamed protein product [Calypogeia fissa]